MRAAGSACAPGLLLAAVFFSLLCYAAADPPISAPLVYAVNWAGCVLLCILEEQAAGCQHALQTQAASNVAAGACKAYVGLDAVAATGNVCWQVHALCTFSWKKKSACTWQPRLSVTAPVSSSMYALPKGSLLWRLCLHEVLKVLVPHLLLCWQHCMCMCMPATGQQ